jgi:glycerol-3-phosphate dehydrogenase
MKITVVGSGYVGLVLGACLAENGNEVMCIDKDTSKIDTLNPLVGTLSSEYRVSCVITIRLRSDCRSSCFRPSGIIGSGKSRRRWHDFRPLGQ